MLELARSASVRLRLAASLRSPGRWLRAELQQRTGIVIVMTTLQRHQQPNWVRPASGPRALSGGARARKLLILVIGGAQAAKAPIGSQQLWARVTYPHSQRLQMQRMGQLAPGSRSARRRNRRCSSSSSGAAPAAIVCVCVCV